MIIFNRQILLDFAHKHTDALNALDKWVSEIENAEWASFVDVRKTFPSADYIGKDHIVFNLKGNNYRIIAVVVFIDDAIFVRWAGTHAEYSKIKDCSMI